MDLEKIGRNLFGKCPFCGGKKSFCISLDKQFAHCFQCNISMDVIKCLTKMKMEEIANKNPDLQSEMGEIKLKAVNPKGYSRYELFIVCFMILVYITIVLGNILVRL